MHNDSTTNGLRDQSEPFAIIGISFIGPQEAIGEKGLWEVLETRKNLMTEWPKDRTTVDSFYDGDPQTPNKLPSRGAHFIKEDPAVFDAPFFSIPPHEAAALDPHQRWALEASYHALENAGIPLERIRGSRTAVFASSLANNWALMMAKDPDTVPRHTIIGTSSNMVPNRISWFFNLQGPSVYVDTACSSGLVALDMACQAMQCGDASAALVIGTSLLFSPEQSTYLGNMGFLSPDGRCFSFDSRANGFGRGEGIVALVVEPLKVALQHGDVVRAVLRGTASNQDGRTPILTQPSASAQENLIRHVYAKAGLDFNSTRYFEAHGTGTAVGDPIEMEAIGRVFRTSRSPDKPLYVGSIKANLGHLEAGSGLASLIKCIMMLEKGVIAPNALLEKLNPDIDADFLNIKIPKEATSWPNPGIRRCSINSFGFGGTNSHAVLDDAFSYLQSHGLNDYFQFLNYPHNSNGVSSSTESSNGSQTLHVFDHLRTVPKPKILVWSTADSAALERMMEKYQTYYCTHIAGRHDRLELLAYTLAARRTAMPWRTFAVVDPMDDPTATHGKAPKGDHEVCLKRSKGSRASTENMSIAYVLTGQGAQYVGMGMELLSYPVFEESLRQSDEILAQLGCKWSIFDVILDNEWISSPEISQPLCTVLQIALVQLLRTFGLAPTAVVGHSSGEIAAAYTIGALSHHSACKVAYYRGQVAERIRRMSASNPGAMMSVNLAETEILAHLESLNPKEKVNIACVNSPTNVTISGPSDSIDVLKVHFDQLGIFAQKLNTGVAYHSPAMQAVSTDYRQSMGTLDMDSDTPKPIIMISSVTGQVVTPEMLALPQYWVDNLLLPVRFSDALQCLQRSPKILSLSSNVGSITDLIEIGPHAALRRPVTDTIPSWRYHATVRRAHNPLLTILGLVGFLYCHGYPVSVLTANAQGDGTRPYLVDCPPYPFDHSRRYWAESRLSRDYRLRPSSSGYLLGKRAHDWNPFRPRWRNWLCTETMPWLADHVVGDRTICPGTGLIVIALEAARQAADATIRPISSFMLRDVQFVAPITIRQTRQDATEILIELRRIENIHDTDSIESEVQIHSYHDGNWELCFSANVEREYEVVQKPDFSWADETFLERTIIQENMDSLAKSCFQPIDKGAFYQFCGKQGLKYGPSFQLLRGIRWDGENNSIARIDMNSTRKILENADSPVHPAILDAILHLTFAQVSKGITKSIPISVPQRIAKIWITAKPWTQGISTVQLSSSKRTISGSRTSFAGNVEAIGDEGVLLCTMENIQMTDVSQIDEQEDGVKRNLLHQIAWKPQLSSMSAVELQELCNLISPPDNSKFREVFFPKIELAMKASARQTLREITKEDVDRAPNHLKKLVAALEHQCGSTKFRDHSELDGCALESLLNECLSEQPAWRVFPLIARALPKIIRGVTNPLEILFGDQAAEDYYAQIFGFLSIDTRLRRLLDLLTHENPGLKILEVGSGTGSMTRIILTAIQTLEREMGHTRFAEYTYTDISPSFFETAREKFADFDDRMGFKLFDLDIDPIQQGLEKGHYDVVIAGSVLHVASNLGTTLHNLHGLLKPNGHLLLLEITNLESVCNTIGFGTLEGWWRGREEWRQHGPLVSEKVWDDLLRDVGFSGVDISLKDGYMTSLMVSTSLSTPKMNRVSKIVNNHNPTDIILLVHADSKSHRTIAAEIQRRHQNTQVVDFTDLGWLSEPKSASKIVVSLLECGAPQLATINESNFHLLQTHIQGARNLLWITGSATMADPHFSLATGLIRCLRSEQASKRIVSLSIESCSPGCEAEFVSRVLNTCFFGDIISSELEFVVRDGYLNIGRLQENVELDAKREEQTSHRLISEPWEPGPPLVLEAGIYGTIDTIRFVEDQTSLDLAPNDVEIKACVWPISFRDIFIALKRMENAGLGIECAGTISRVGAACSNRFTPGERVLMVYPGTMRSHPRAPADAVFKLPATLSFHDAVAGMIPGMTAWYALVHIGRLRRRDKILIHSAAGGTGQMAVKIAKMLGAEIFTTVGSKEKRDLVVNLLRIPESHVFYSRDLSFVKGIKRVTDGYGVDVVLNSLSGRGLRASWECVAPYGRFIDLGKSDIMANSSLPMAGFADNVSFASVDLEHVTLKNSALVRDLVQKVLDLAGDRGIGGPTPLHAFPVSQVREAFKFMESGKNTGRILITAESKEVTSKYLLHKKSPLFQAQASYIVAGGLGSLGRVVLRWMADRGARNLIVPSRSGRVSQAASKVVSELISEGINILTPTCNLSSSEELGALLQTCESMPPVRGCINLAMVLQDAIFDNMTHAQWTQAIRSKVDATWNLHQLLPPKMDFFILASSFVGVLGSPSQSNYAAGCTFQDALSYMRTIREEFGPTISLDLAWVDDIDVDADNADRLRHMGEHVRHMGTVQTRDVLAILEHFCDRSQSAFGVEEGQLLIGTNVPSVADADSGGSFPQHLVRPMFAPFLVKRINSTKSRKKGAGSAQKDAVQGFRQAKDIAERCTAFLDALTMKLSLMLGVQVEDIDTCKSLSDYSIDSLTAVELRNWIWRSFRASVAVFDIMGGKDLKTVAKLVAEKAE